MKKLIIGSLLLMSCHGAKVPKSVIEDSNSTMDLVENGQLESLAEEMYGDRYGFDSNSEKSFTIVKSKYKKIQDLLPNISFFIYDHDKELIILSDTLLAGYVGWESEYQVKTISRMVSENDGNMLSKRIKYFDVQTREFVAEP